MDWFVRNFIRAALAWLGLGAALGLAMVMHAPWVVYRAAHLHMNLLGFVTMMISGVGYHVMPRFVSRALYSPRLATVHWWLANSGLALLVAGFLLAPHSAGASRGPLVAGGALSAAGLFAFAFNLWRTIGAGVLAPPPAGSAPVMPLRRQLAPDPPGGEA